MEKIKGDEGGRSETNIADMTKISNININIINENLENRYKSDLIYTYIDNILLAINPYKELDIYGFDYIHKYSPSKNWNDFLEVIRSAQKLPPHIYSITQKCYCQLNNPILQPLPQSILITGESGSGKTETSKFVLQYLCEISSNENYWLQEQILEGNVILEAFGNATTIRNNNSSRFGKFLQIYFNHNVITGAVVTNYLLEKSRIVGQSENERNYHIFYQLLNSSAEKYLLQPINYKYCRQYDPTVKNPTDHSNWNHLLVSLNVLEFSSESIDMIFSLLSVILWFGNLEFIALDEDHDKITLSPQSLEIIKTISSLLHLPSESLLTLLLQRQITIRGTVTDIPFNLQEGSDNRHSMSQYLYMKLFTFLIFFINGRINRSVQQSSTLFIGLLDIFGFENFDTNSFEQICINYSNEKLQAYFNEYIFRVEQEMYQSEGLDYSYITFLDNSNCLEFLEKTPRSLLKLLSEQCHLPKGSDSAFLQNLTTEHASTPSFSLPSDRRMWNEQFNVVHYAGVVTYSVLNFVNKNRHLVQEGFHNYLLGNDSIKTIISCNEKITTATLKYKSTLIEDFRQELSSLMNVLQSSEPWYIRCLKPNFSKEPNNYDNKYILEQLNYLGIEDLVKIKQSGYPVNYSVDEFVKKYKILTKSQGRSPNVTYTDIIERVQNGCTKFTSPQDFQLGSSKIFLRSSLHSSLDSARNSLILRSTIRIQSAWRAHSAARGYRAQLGAAVVIQKYFRSMRTRAHFLSLKKSALVLQAHLRGKYGREVVKSLKEMKRIEREVKAREEERRNSATMSSNYNSVDELLDLLLNEESEIRGPYSDLKGSSEEFKSSVSINSSLTSFTDDDYDINDEGGSGTGSEICSNTSIPPSDLSLTSSDKKSEDFEPIPSELCEENTPLALPKTPLTESEGKKLQKQPSLPEPTLPPPPPPQLPNFSTNKVKGDGEPIYESIRVQNVPLSPKTVVLEPEPIIKNYESSTIIGVELKSECPALKSEGNEIEEEIEEEQIPSPPPPMSSIHNILNYANDYFNDIYESNLMDTLKKKPKLVPKSDMVKYTKCTTISNSHIYLYDPENVQLALCLWKDLQKHLNSTRTSTSFIQSLVTHGLQREELRDEIYIQLLRQINGNQNTGQLIKLISLLQFVMRVFQCSSELRKYLASFLNQVSASTTDMRIKNHLMNLLKSTTEFWGNRKVIPSALEINFYFQSSQQLIHHVKLYLLNNSYLLLNTHPTDTYDTLLSKLALLLKTDFVNDGSWGIYESTGDLSQMYYLPKYDYVYDMIASWERANELHVQQSSPNLIVTNPSKKLVLKKRLFRPSTLLPPSHPLEINLTYLQCIHEVVRLDKYLVSDKIGTALAGIQLQLLFGDFKTKLDYRPEDSLPSRLLKLRPVDKWVALLEDSHLQTSRLGENKLALQLRYINCVRKLPFYGTTIFDLSYYGYRDYDPHLLLGINSSTILLIQQDRTILNQFPYEEISSLSIQEDSLILHLPASKYVFKTSFTPDIFSLITSYYPRLKKSGENTTKLITPLVTNSFRSKLLKNLIEARDLLVANNYLNGEAASSTLRLRGKKIGSSTFNFSKSPILHSVLKLSGADEASAVEIFKFILMYTQADGDLRVFLNKLSNSNLLNEAYLQLMKQTNSSVPNSSVTRKTWSLLNLLTNYLLPTNKLIMNYLICHLRYYGLDSVTVVGDYARSVMKSLQNTNTQNKLTKAVRKYVPSSIEINHVILFKPITVKVYLLNNNYYSVELANHFDSIQDVLGILFNYIGLDGPDCRGYGIYETSTLNGNYCENYIIPATPVVDVLGRWETNGTNGGSPNGQNPNSLLKYKLVFKKYLNKFLNLNNPIEKELLLQQLLFNIKINKYPINTNEGEILIALLSQVHLGNYEQNEPGEFPDYCSILSKYFPTNLSVNISYERVSYYHQSLVGSKAEESYKSIFNLLTSWPLYKGSLFSVVQSFTPSWPRNLWLILDETGIFLLEEKSKNVISNYNYNDLLNFIPTTNYLMLIVRNEAKGVKIILHTIESYSITYMIREYINV